VYSVLKFNVIALVFNEEKRVHSLVGNWNKKERKKELSNVSNNRKSKQEAQLPHR